MKLYKIITIIITLFSLQNSTAQSQKKLNTYISLLNDNNRAMGGVTISRDNNVAYENYFGFSNIETKLDINKQTLFRIGSVTKMFTAVICFQLIEENKLKLEDTLEAFFPQATNASKITIANLLSHRSGIMDYTKDSEFMKNYTKHIDNEKLIKKITSYPSNFQSGSTAEYSNSNYILLGKIIELVSNTSYEEQLKNRIIKKLGLKRTFYAKPIEKEKNEAKSYYRNNENWESYSDTNPSYSATAGAIVSTSRDLNLFIGALKNYQLISNKSLKVMNTITDGLGSGMFQTQFGSRVSKGHSGLIDGFNSFTGYFEKDNVTISLTLNGTVDNSFEILSSIIKIYFKEPFTMPNYSIKHAELTLDELNNYLGTFISKTAPFELTLTQEGGQLMGQASHGSSKILLTTNNKNLFENKDMGIKIIFDLDNPYKKFTLFMTGMEEYKFIKK